MNECVETTWPRVPDGYGTKSVNGVSKRAHRYAWEQAHGPIPEGLFVLHHCDNPPCINVEHLFLGTNSDNMRDAASKVRLGVQRNPSLVQGERRSNHKLTDDIVREIRASSDTTRGLARRFGVAAPVLRRARQGKTWRHLLGPDLPGSPQALEEK